MPLTSTVMRQSVSNFRLYCCSKKLQKLRKNVKSLLEQLQVCIFAEIVFGVRCTLKGTLLLVNGISCSGVLKLFLRLNADSWIVQHMQIAISTMISLNYYMIYSNYLDSRS